MNPEVKTRVFSMFPSSPSTKGSQCCFKINFGYFDEHGNLLPPTFCAALTIYVNEGKTARSHCATPSNLLPHIRILALNQQTCQGRWIYQRPFYHLKSKWPSLRFQALQPYLYGTIHFSGTQQFDSAWSDGQTFSSVTANTFHWIPLFGAKIARCATDNLSEF